jgi:hypothetical protein
MPTTPSGIRALCSDVTFRTRLGAHSIAQVIVGADLRDRARPILARTRPALGTHLTPTLRSSVWAVIRSPACIRRLSRDALPSPARTNCLKRPNVLSSCSC